MDSLLRVRHSRHDQGIEVWTLIGEIDLLTIPLLNFALCCAGAQHSVFDLTGVTFLDLAGARALAAAAEHARDNKRRFSVLARATGVRRALTVTGLADRLEIHCTLDEVFTNHHIEHSRTDLTSTTETPRRTHHLTGGIKHRREPWMGSSTGSATLIDAAKLAAGLRHRTPRDPPLTE